MNKKLFVGGIPSDLRWQNLKEIFSEFGEVVFAKVVVQKETNRSKFGFVDFADPEDAAKAKEEMDGAEINGRRIKVDFAREDSDRRRNYEEKQDIEERNGNNND